MTEAVDRAVIIPHWVSLPAVRPTQAEADGLREKLRIPPGCPVLLFLGRISGQKGVLEILAAFDRLWTKRPESFLVLVGPLDPGYGAKVADRLARLSSRSNIRMLAPIYDESKFTLFAIASLFITLSHNEGLPNAVLEAIASGVPVVITEQSNLPEVAQFEAGVIVPHEPAVVAAKLEALFADPAGLGRMGAQAKSLSSERFTPEAVMPELLTLYRRVAAGPPCCRKVHPGTLII
jgi:glycosyltransferase involved in cell wall biosynthesis